MKYALSAFALALFTASLAPAQTAYWKPEALPKQDYSKLRTYQDARTMQAIADRSAPMRQASQLPPTQETHAAKKGNRYSRSGKKTRFARAGKRTRFAKNRYSENPQTLLAQQAGAGR